jgi:hypothetical protein
MADMYAPSFMAAARPMIAARRLAKEDADTVYQLFLNPDFSYPGRTLFSTRDRKPSLLPATPYSSTKYITIARYTR